MIIQKTKVGLTPEQETLLIPLYSRAQDSLKPNPILNDKKAREILENIDYDFHRLRIPGKTDILLCLRAKKFDTYTLEFINREPDSLVISLGCGLDNRYNRLETKPSQWIDLDTPVVIDLRKQFYAESATYRMIASSVTDLEWVNKIAARGRPVLVIAEGLFMYLSESKVKAIIQTLHETFPGCRLAFDAYSELTARRARKHPALKTTGAVVRWGINDARKIEQWVDGVRLMEEWYFTNDDAIRSLGFGNRLTFRIAGFFKAARKAHRILIFQL